MGAAAIFYNSTPEYDRARLIANSRPIKRIKHWWGMRLPRKLKKTRQKEAAKAAA